jgi:hypothetical protein
MFRYIYGIGISYREGYLNDIDVAMNEMPNTVLHFIAGIDDIDTIKQFRGRNILILGYKDYGFGENYKLMNSVIDDNILKLKQRIHEIIQMGHVSFDTLAIEQLGIQRFFTEERWQTMFMGEEGAFSMYVDVVKNEYAISSFSKERHECTGNIVSIWKDLQLIRK